MLNWYNIVVQMFNRELTDLQNKISAVIFEILKNNDYSKLQEF